MEKILSQKKKVRLLRCGYIFRKDKVIKDGGTSCRCIRRTCCGRLRVGVTDDVISSTEHNHEPELTRNEVGKVEWTNEKPRQLFHHTATPSAITTLHKQNGRRRLSRRRRQ